MNVRKPFTLSSQGERADQILLSHLRETWPALSRARLKPIFQNGLVQVAGRRVRGSDPIPPGRHIWEISAKGWNELEEGQDSKARPSQKGSFIPLVYEDENILVLDKPSGVPSIPQSASETQTAVGSALAHAPELSQIGKGGLEPSILHRLDTGTSGLLAFAKTQPEYDRLRALWGRGGVRKIYRALSPKGDQIPLSPPAEFRFHLAHDPDSAKRMLIYQSAKKTKIRGKPLPTLTRITRVSHSETLLDLEVEIETGVMHQIRATLAHLGFPILGDPIYRGAPSERLWLHAWKLDLPKADGSLLRLESPLPKDWLESPR